MFTTNYQYTTQNPLRNLQISTVAIAETADKEWQQLAGVDKDNMKVNKRINFEGVGAAGVKTEGSAPEGKSITEGYVESVTQVTYGAEFAITMEQQTYSMSDANFLKQVSTMRAQSISLSYEYQVADAYTSGFSVHTTGDAQYFFDSDHVNKSDGSTFSNLLTTSVFDKTSLEDGVIQITQQQIEYNIPVKLMPQEIRYGSDYVMVVKEVLKSVKDPDTANNTHNAVTDWNLKPVMGHYLTTNDWFISCAKNDGEEAVSVIETISPTFAEDKERTGAMNLILNGICAFGVMKDGRRAIRLYGNTGA
jgi:hypothetical protein